MGLKEEQEKLVHGWLFNIADKIADSFAQLVPRFVKDIFDNVEKNSPRVEDAWWLKYCQNLVESGWMDQDTADLLKTVKDHSWPLNLIMTLVVPIQMVMSRFRSMVDIYSLDVQYENMARTTPHPAPVDNLVRAMIIDPDRAAENRVELKKHGYSDTQIDNIILSYYRVVDEEVVRVNYLRGNIDTATLYERMRELGYTDTRTREIIKTWTLLPGPSDLFTMVAHEAFEPAIYKKLGLEEEFPAEQVEWLKMQGISEEWAKKYWIAHWEQPSVQQGFEMLHRGVIDKATLDMLFKTVEIPRFWRDKLTAIAYSPYTRVDVRRMHQLGVIDDDELVTAYMDLGYDQDKAVKMATFTLKYNSEQEQELSRSSILSSYASGLISKKDARDLLTSQDYSTDLADFYLVMEDYRKEKERQDNKVDMTREQYLLRRISETEVRDTLGKLNLQGSRVDELMDQWKWELYKYAQLPSKSDLDRWFLSGMIEELHYRLHMQRHGYEGNVIDLYLEELRRELPLGARQPTRADLQGWYKKKLITREQFTDYLVRQGYEPKFAEMYFKSM